MPLTTFAKRCAQAMFELARENGKLDEWRPELQEIAQLAADPEIAAFMENTKVPLEQKMKALSERLTGISHLPLNLAYFLIAKGKFRDLPEVVRAYEELLDEQYGIRHAKVISAVPLTEAEKESVKQYLESIAKGKVVLTLEVKPDIIGGFVARVNSTLIDGSIRTRLEALRKALVGAGR